MNGFDIALIAVVALSTLFGLARGVIRELIALATWVVGFVVAIGFSGPLADQFPWLDVAPVLKQAFAFGLILIAVMIVGAIALRMLTGVVRAIGLGFTDRMLGAVFGVGRGLVAVVAFALIAGATTLPKHDWWQNSALGEPLAHAALAVKPYLPRAWAERLDFSAAGIFSARLGEHRSCAES
jgi:membrane protein required for colicin V production